MILTCSKCNKDLEKPRTHTKFGYAVCLECKKKYQREYARKYHKKQTTTCVEPSGNGLRQGYKK